MEAEGFPITKSSPAPEIGPGIGPEIGPEIGRMNSRMNSPGISPQIGAQIGAGGEPRIGRGRDAQLGPRVHPLRWGLDHVRDPAHVLVRQQLARLGRVAWQGAQRLDPRLFTVEQISKAMLLLGTLALR